MSPVEEEEKSKKKTFVEYDLVFGGAFVSENWFHNGAWVATTSNTEELISSDNAFSASIISNNLVDDLSDVSGVINNNDTSYPYSYAISISQLRFLILIVRQAQNQLI